ncbi:MAG: cell division protein ZapD [Gammaproteobacteria bacterium]|jgi:cell division protein ZapD
MSRLPNSTVIYEQPLNERMRAFLRLEHLFHRVEHELGNSDPWSNRTALETIISIMTIVSRADLKAELMSELKRHAGTLEGLEHNPHVDLERLHTILGKTRSLLEGLRTGEGPLGAELKDNELLGSIRQRASIPAGTCAFDAPGLHFWLQGSDDHRLGDLRRWLATYDAVRDTVFLCLSLVRESASATRETAVAGYFQQSLAKGSTYQMVRIALPADAPWYPEVSAGPHRFTIRFLMQATENARPQQVGENVEFDLLYCVL